MVKRQPVDVKYRRGDEPLMQLAARERGMPGCPFSLPIPIDAEITSTATGCHPLENAIWRTLLGFLDRHHRTLQNLELNST